MKGKKILKTFFRFLLPVLTVAVLLFIFFNSMHDSKTVAAPTKAVTKAVTKVVKSVSTEKLTSSVANRIAAKIGHAGEFSIFAFLLTLSAALRRRSAEGLGFQVLAVSLFSAVTDEYLQTYFDRRTPAVTDVMIDLAGALCGFALALLAGWLIVRYSSKNRAKN